MDHVVAHDVVVAAVFDLDAVSLADVGAVQVVDVVALDQAVKHVPRR